MCGNPLKLIPLAKRSRQVAKRLSQPAVTVKASDAAIGSDAAIEKMLLLLAQGLRETPKLGGNNARAIMIAIEPHTIDFDLDEMFCQIRS
jgi:hypothetical protein